LSAVQRWQRHDEVAEVDHVAHVLPGAFGHLSGTRIVQVSDLHIGRFMRSEHWSAHIARVNALRPDLIVITGDAMDWSRRYEDDFVAPLQNLRPRVATLAILGNHDFYFGGDRLARAYRTASDVILLRGDNFRSDALPGLAVWGMDDPMTPLALPGRYPKLRRWARGLNPDEYNLLLSHRPDAFRYAPGLGFDLQLSGHTHGGQIVVTAPWGKRIHIASVLGRWDRGEFERSRTGRARTTRVSRLYVNRGLGFAGVPYRRDCPSEITVHTLNSASAAVAA
jgi:predicted MPP superfamily phosphohydrolase